MRTLSQYPHNRPSKTRVYWWWVIQSSLLTQPISQDVRQRSPFALFVDRLHERNEERIPNHATRVPPADSL